MHGVSSTTQSSTPRSAGQVVFWNECGTGQDHGWQDMPVLLFGYAPLGKYGADEWNLGEMSEFVRPVALAHVGFWRFPSSKVQ